MYNAHGGDIYSYAEQFGQPPLLDFSANINPHGMPPGVRKALHDAIDRCTQYPDPYCRALRSALGLRWNLSSQYIFCGNGAAEIFYRLIHSIQPKTALLTAPTFAEYEAALRTIRCHLRFHILKAEESFYVTEQILEQLTPDLELLILCNPNNPTGCTICTSLLEQILLQCEKNNTWVILDECFCDFLVDADAHTMYTWLEHMRRLIIVRSFTKMYAIPGVRLGWCMTTNIPLMEKLYLAGPPWSVSILAQHCGIAALQCTDWEIRTAREIEHNRKILSCALTQCGFRVFPAQANYILFNTSYTDLRERLLPKGILIRSCTNYLGLGEGYFRVAVRTQTENTLLIQAIQEVISSGKSNYDPRNRIECREERTGSRTLSHF